MVLERDEGARRDVVEASRCASSTPESSSGCNVQHVEQDVVSSQVASRAQARTAAECKFVSDDDDREGSTNAC